MKPVYLASPLRADDTTAVRRNLAYARKAMEYSLALDEAPFVPHLLYPQALNDADDGDRWLGQEAGKAWLARSEALVVYGDLGISPGMAAEIELAAALRIPVEIRYIQSAKRTRKRDEPKPTDNPEPDNMS